MHLLDRYAYSNRIRKLHPAYKAGCSLSALILCLGISSLGFSLFVLLVMLGLTIFWARLPARFVLRLTFVEGSFLLFGVLGVAVSVSGISSPGAVVVGPFWVNLTAETIWRAGILLTRALGCVAAMNFLALTTPVVDLIDLMRRLRVPAVLIELMILMYRFIFVLLESLERMILAQEVRLGFQNWRCSLQSVAQIGANLFIEAFRRSKRLEIALQGRAWDGTLRVLPQEYEHPFSRRAIERKTHHDN